ncbi:hypothetical protein HerbRD11066_08820 [Herbidospora sp. RD11066]
MPEIMERTSRIPSMNDVEIGIINNRLESQNRYRWVDPTHDAARLQPCGDSDRRSVQKNHENGLSQARALT